MAERNGVGQQAGVKSSLSGQGGRKEGRDFRLRYSEEPGVILNVNGQ